MIVNFNWWIVVSNIILAWHSKIAWEKSSIDKLLIDDCSDTVIVDWDSQSGSKSNPTDLA